MNIFLSSESFVSLIAAVVEGFKNEVGGILFGDYFPTVEKMSVSHVLPLQTAKRSFSSVEFHPGRTERVLEIWDILYTDLTLGMFHSHPSFGEKNYTADPSDVDIEYLHPEEIMIIVAIREAKRKIKLDYRKEGYRITGAAGKYHIEIAGWYLDEAEEEVIEAEMWCPYIDIINMPYTMGLVKRPGRVFDDNLEVRLTDLRKLKGLIKKYEHFVFRHLTSRGAGRIRQEIRKVLKQMNYG